MRVLVTGASGFLGRHVVSRLLERAQEVRVLTRDKNHLPLGWDGRLQVVLGDIRCPETLGPAVDGVEMVFNVAGEWRDRTQFQRVNEQGTRNVLRTCVLAGGISIVHVSSAGVIGARLPGKYDESSQCRPGNAYERSKLVGEREVLRCSREGRLRATVVRPTTVFGFRLPGGRDSFLSLLGAIQRGQFRFLGGLAAVSNYVYVEDVAECCIALSGDPTADGEVFHVADPCPLQEFVGEAADLLGVPHPGRIPAAVALSAALVFEVARHFRGWAPLTLGRYRALRSRTEIKGDRLRQRVSFPVGWRAGLARTIAQYRAAGAL